MCAVHNHSNFFFAAKEFLSHQMQGHLKGEGALHGFAINGKLDASAKFVEDSCFQVSAIGATDGPLVSVSVSVPVKAFWAEKATEQQRLEENEYDEESRIICDKSVGTFSLFFGKTVFEAIFLFYSFDLTNIQEEISLRR